MNDFKTFILISGDCNRLFEGLFHAISWKSHQMELMISAETDSKQFVHILLEEETTQQLCSSQQATYLGEKILLLLDRLYFLLADSREHRQQINLLAVSTGIWIAERHGVIRELDHLVNGIAAFANHCSLQQELLELYEISLRIIYAVDDYLKADLDKHNTHRPWRLLCLNQCIIATRTGNGELIKLAYNRLIDSLPEEAETFFKMALENVNKGGYPVDCKNIVQAYEQMYRKNKMPPEESRLSLN